MDADPKQPPAVFVGKDNEEYHADQCMALASAAAAENLRMRAFSRRSYPGERLPNDRLEEVCTVGYWDAQKAQDWGLDWHFNEGIEFTYLDAGNLAFSVDEHHRELTPGDLTVTRPWQRHRVGDPTVTPSRLVWFILDVGVRHPHADWRWPSWILMDAKELADLTAVLRGHEAPVSRANAEVTKHFRSLCTILDENEALPETHFKIWVNQFLLALHELLVSRGDTVDQSLSSADRTAQMVLDVVERHPEREWTLDGMAREAGMARSRFGECCKRISNCTPMDFVAQRRCEHAAKLLDEDPSTPIAEIAKACGFNSTQYFCNQFKRRMGHTPKAWASREL